MELVILGTVLGAVLTWVLSYFLPSRDSTKLVQAQESLAQSQKALAQAEADRAQSDAERVALEKKLAQLAGFNWAARVLNEAPRRQEIEVDANEDMEAVRLTYCSDTGAGIVTEDFHATIRGRTIRIPINRESLLQVQRVKYDGRTGSFDLFFKIRVRVLGEYRELTVPAHGHSRQVVTAMYLDVRG